LSSMPPCEKAIHVVSASRHCKPMKTTVAIRIALVAYGCDASVAKCVSPVVSACKLISYARSMQTSRRTFARTSVVGDAWYWESFKTTSIDSYSRITQKRVLEMVSLFQ
jgi:hypothetical protein